jgi:hypothetical protein
MSEPDLIIARFHSDAYLDDKGIAEVIALRRLITRDKPVSVLAIFLAKVDLEPNAVSTNHYMEPETWVGLKALAIVATKPFHWSLGDLFFRYYPQPFPSDVFHTEEEARAWLADPKMRPTYV